MTDDSIFTHEERAIADALREGEDLETIAADRGYDVEVVERARERIRQKTRRALATLAQSPDLEAALADLPAERRADLRDRIADRED